MTTFVNFFGSPGAGKTTLATGVFSALRRRGLSAEYVPEYAKELTRSAPHLLVNQPLILGEQLRRIQALIGHVEYIVTDSPPLMQAYYARESGWSGLAADIFTQCAPLHQAGLALNFLVNPPHFDEAYEEEGRTQDREAALLIDGEIAELLREARAQFFHINARAPKVIKSILTLVG